MRKDSKSMPLPMTKRRLKVKMARTATNSTQNGKQAAKFISGGGAKLNPEVGGSSPWNAGNCYPSKVYKKY